MSAAKILVLGGTRFVGRAVVASALARGHQVTLFNRGLTNPNLFPDTEVVTGDRTVSLEPLGGRHFDAVVDVAGYDPAVVELSVKALAATVDRYVYVSTLSVYADHDTAAGQREGARLLDPRPDTGPEDRYGANKAACEAVVTTAYGNGALIARPGLIAGPHDPTDRFAYWPRRVAAGGTILAPGDPADPVQYIDVRDLAGWCVEGCGQPWRGAYNIVAPPLPMADFMVACQAVTGVGAKLVWASGDWLHAHGVDPWMGVPLWVGAPGWSAANQVDASQAVGHTGLVARSTEATIADIWEWDTARGGPAPGQEGLTAQGEAALLAQLES
jgi:2'-hydroxyisoflavone reductase